MTSTRPLTLPVLQKVAQARRSKSRPDLIGIGPDDGGAAVNEEVGRLIAEGHVSGPSTYFQGTKVHIADELTPSGEDLLRSLGGKP